PGSGGPGNGVATTLRSESRRHSGSAAAQLCIGSQSLDEWRGRVICVADSTRGMTDLAMAAGSRVRVPATGGLQGLCAAELCEMRKSDARLTAAICRPPEVSV